jgi:hypothetical protein
MDTTNPLLANHLPDDDLARALGRSTRTVKRWRALRIGPPCVYVGKTPYTSIETAKRWLAAREQKLPRAAHR